MVGAIPDAGGTGKKQTKEKNMKTHIETTPEIETAFSDFKQVDHPNIIADSIIELCEAEARRIHACSNGTDSAAILAEVVGKPSPVKSFEFDQENGLEIFADGSLYEKSNADSTVWFEAGDFYRHRLEEPVTAGLREFFNVSAPEDADEFRITVRRSWYGSLITENFADLDDRSEVAKFPSRESAQQWIDEREAGEYRLSHNEASRPEYIITPCA
jgi:hypothetical protein